MNNDEPDELDELVGYLNKVDRYLGIELGASVDIWTPKETSLLLIEKRLEHGVLRGTVEAVLDSYQQEAFSLYSYRDTSRSHSRRSRGGWQFCLRFLTPFPRSHWWTRN